MSIDIAKDIVNIAENMQIVEDLNLKEKIKLKLIKNMINVEIYYTFTDEFNDTEYDSNTAYYKFSKINTCFDKKKLFWVIKHDEITNDFAIINIEDNMKFIEKILGDLEVSLDVYSNQFIRRKKFVVKIRIPSTISEQDMFNINVCCHVEEYNKYTSLRSIIMDFFEFIKNIDIL